MFDLVLWHYSKQGSIAYAKNPLLNCLLVRVNHNVGGFDRGLPAMWGFMMGSLLMFIGSLLGLTWQPPAK